ncbi:hypothetical protein Tco_0904415 [Tanacetum coccineum]
MILCCCKGCLLSAAGWLPYDSCAVNSLSKQEWLLKEWLLLSQWFREDGFSVPNISNYAVEIPRCRLCIDWEGTKEVDDSHYCPMGGNQETCTDVWKDTMEKAIEFANDQMDQKVLTITKRQAEQKRKLEFNAGKNQGNQQQNKKQNTRRAYTVGPGEKREYTGSLPLSMRHEGDFSLSSASSAVTYTSVYTDSEPGRVFWGADEELSDGGSPRVIVYGYDGLPMQSVAPQSPYYVPGPEHPSSLRLFLRYQGPENPPSPVEVPYVPEPEYPEYLAPSDVEAPLEDQPLPIDASPTALSPGYVADSDPEEDLEEDPKEDHSDYPVDGGDDDDELSNDDTDDEDEEPFEDEDDKEEEHLALAESSVVPVVDHVPSAGDKKGI